jgi:hypothetical protein
VSRSRYRSRPKLGETLLAAAFVGGLSYLLLTWAAHMNGNAALMCGVIAAGVMLRHRIRVPYVRIGWRRR